MRRDDANDLPVEHLRRAYAAFNARDIDGALSLIDEQQECWVDFDQEEKKLNCEVRPRIWEAIATMYRDQGWSLARA